MVKEITDIISAFDTACNNNQLTALATVVKVEGSAYRREGARMLVTANGQLTGAISGGCLEGDALRRARLAISTNRNLLVTYDTTDDDDGQLGVGLGCNGIIHLLIEPIDVQNPQNPIALLKAAINSRQPAVLVTLFSITHKQQQQPGTVLLALSTGQTLSNTNPTNILQALTPQAHTLLKQAPNLHLQAVAHSPLVALFERISPPLHIAIAGAGNDVIPLTHFAHILGWECSVFDGRANYASTQRFPLAKRVIVCRPAEVLPHFAQHTPDAWLLMTHNYRYELELLKQLSGIQPAYIGILGPRKKWDMMAAELQQSGFILSQAWLQNVHSPVGLDLGAEGAEEIALAIVAELKAFTSGKKNINYLKYKDAPIHTPTI